MAGHLSYFGNEICLWNRSHKTIEKISSNNNIIKVRGVINSDVKISKVTSNIKEAIKGAELILIATPATSHRELAAILAKEMIKSIPIILNPGRTFGAYNFYNTFIKEGGLFKPKVAETQTIIYTCRKIEDDTVVIYSLKKAVKIAAISKNIIGEIYLAIPDCIRDNYICAESFLETSLGNVGMVLHCIPFMLNIGWTECKTAEYKYYYDGITPTIGKFIQHIDDERVLVGKAMGISLESTCEWMIREYDTYGKTIYDAINNNISYKEIDAPKTVNHRYIYEDVPHGLVPIERLGNLLDIDTPYIKIAIDLANAIMETDYRKKGEYITLDNINNFLKEM